MTIVERPRLAEVGVSVPRKDGREKLSGQAQYIGDIEVAGMLHGKVLRSPVAHAADQVDRYLARRSRWMAWSPR